MERRARLRDAGIEIARFHGVVRLAPRPTLPEGARVRVVYGPPADQPFDREPVSETDVLADIAWARGDRFR